jgi:hypothetical protein
VRSRNLRDMRRHVWRGSTISPSDARKISATQVRDSDVVLCIQASAIDSIALHLGLSKIDAMAKILQEINGIEEKRGEHQLKIIKTPIVLWISFRKHDGKICAEIQLSTKNIIVSVDKLSSLIADEALKREMDSF